MNDPVLQKFLQRQYAEIRALESESDILHVLDLSDAPVTRYVLALECGGLVKDRAGQVGETGRFVLGVRFPDDYLRRVSPPEVVTLLEPVGAFHPNVAFPFICPGRLVPGTPLVDIVYQCFEIFTHQKMNLTDPLNEEACEWMRRHPERAPVDDRPLKWRAESQEAL